MVGQHHGCWCPGSCMARSSAAIIHEKRCSITYDITALRNDKWLIQVYFYVSSEITAHKMSLFPGRQIFTWKMLREKTQAIHEKLTKDHRIDILAPKPVRGLVKLLLQGDHKVRNKAKSQEVFMNLLVTCFLEITLLKLLAHIPGANELIQWKPFIGMCKI